MIDGKELQHYLSQIFDGVEVRRESIPGMTVIKVKFQSLNDYECSLRFVYKGGKLKLWRVSYEE